MTVKEFRQQLKELIEEDSTSGAVGGIRTPNAFNPNKKASGTSRNYYLKQGYKLVDKAKVRKAAKGMVYTDLWK